MAMVPGYRLSLATMMIAVQRSNNIMRRGVFCYCGCGTCVINNQASLPLPPPPSLSHSRARAVAEKHIIDIITLSYYPELAYYARTALAKMD